MSGVEWFGEEILRNMEGAADTALATCAADLQSKSANRAPIDTGKLRESCLIEDAGEHALLVGYSKEVDDYAMIQHERMDFIHPRGGEPKYLENPLNENAKRYVEYIGEQAGKAAK